MQNTFRQSRKLLLAGVLAAFSLGVGTAAAAGDAPSGIFIKVNNFSWNFGFGNSISFGKNRVKGSGVLKDESRAVANFSRLVLALPATVSITQGANESLTITADDNLLPLMNTRVENGELLIDCDEKRGFSSRENITIRLTVRSLDSIKIKGSGDVVGGELKSDKLDIVIAGSGDVKFNVIRAEQLSVGIQGSGDIKLDSIISKLVDASIRGSGDIRMPSLQASSVKISVHGSGDVSAGGNTDKVDIEVRGSGDVRARRLIAREASASISASGDIEVNAQERLSANVTGSGDIRYAGSPVTVSRTVRGSGSIEAL